MAPDTGQMGNHWALVAFPAPQQMVSNRLAQSFTKSGREGKGLGIGPLAQRRVGGGDCVQLPGIQPPPPGLARPHIPTPPLPAPSPPPPPAPCSLELNRQGSNRQKQKLWWGGPWWNRFHPSLWRLLKTQYSPRLPTKAARAGTHTNTQLNVFWALIYCVSSSHLSAKARAPYNVLSPPSSLSQYVHLSANLLPALWTFRGRILTLVSSALKHPRVVWRTDEINPSSTCSLQLYS